MNYEDELLKTANTYNVDPYELHEYLMKEAGIKDIFTNTVKDLSQQYDPRKLPGGIAKHVKNLKSDPIKNLPSAAKDAAKVGFIGIPGTIPLIAGFETLKQTAKDPDVRKTVGKGLNKAKDIGKNLSNKNMPNLKDKGKQGLDFLKNKITKTGGINSMYGYDRYRQLTKEANVNALRGGAVGAGLGALSGAGRAAMNMQAGGQMGQMGQMDKKQILMQLLRSGAYQGMQGGALGAGAGHLMGQQAQQMQQQPQQQEQTKEAAAEHYMDGLQKVSAATGIDAETLHQGIDLFVKEAQIHDILDNYEEEEAETILKEAAANDPTVAGLAQQAQEDRENDLLSKVAGWIDGLSDDEAKELLAEVE